MITIDDPEAERAAYELAARRGQSVQAMVRAALLAAQTASEQTPRTGPLARTPEELRTLLGRVRAVQAEASRLPVLDSRPADQLLGYDEYGLPT